MPLSVNDPAPDFTLPSTSGEDFQLSDLKGQAVVLYFYPKDFTGVCTKEACAFRDQFMAFRNLDVSVFGISKDDLETHHRFKDKYELPFELLADTEGKVTKKYKVAIPIIGMPRRITYVLDTGHKVKAVIEDMFNADVHIKEALEKIREGKLESDG